MEISKKERFPGNFFPGNVLFLLKAGQSGANRGLLVAQTRKNGRSSLGQKFDEILQRRLTLKNKAVLYGGSIWGRKNFIIKRD